MKQTAPFFSVTARVSTRTSVVNGWPWANGKAKSFAVHGTTAMGVITGALLDGSTGVTQSSARPELHVVRKTIVE